MNYGKVYLKAMEILNRNARMYSCVAVSYAATGYGAYRPGNNAVVLYAKIFSPDGTPGTSYSPFVRQVERDPDPKALRLTMLAMAAACWKDMLPLMEGE